MRGSIGTIVVDEDDLPSDTGKGCIEGRIIGSTFTASQYVGTMTLRRGAAMRVPLSRPNGSSTYEVVKTTCRVRRVVMTGESLHRDYRTRRSTHEVECGIRRICSVRDGPNCTKDSANQLKDVRQRSLEYDATVSA